MSKTIPVGIFVKDEEEPFLIPADPIPQGFPDEFVPFLAEVFISGFDLAMSLNMIPKYRNKRPRGRPIAPRARDQGREAAMLHKQGSSYGAIALQLCEEAGKNDHRCGKACIDRIRQRARSVSSMRGTLPAREK
jgi:hypothetical protein